MCVWLSSKRVDRSLAYLDARRWPCARINGGRALGPGFRCSWREACCASLPDKHGTMRKARRTSPPVSGHLVVIAEVVRQAQRQCVESCGLRRQIQSRGIGPAHDARPSSRDKPSPYTLAYGQALPRGPALPRATVSPRMKQIAFAIR